MLKLIFRGLFKIFLALFLAVGPLLALAWMVGWYYKDRSLSMIWFFFIPAPAVALAGMAWLLVTYRWARRIGWQFTAVLYAIVVLKVLAIDMAWHTGYTRHEGNIRVVHWNTARGYFGIAKVLSALQQDQPDICLLTEAPGVYDLAEMAHRRFGTRYILAESGMTLLSRYPVIPVGSITIPDGRAWSAHIESPQGTFELLAVDLISRPLFDRGPPLLAIAQWIQKRNSSEPLLVVGDFNTPRDALSFKPVRELLRNAYETAGCGWPYSWPFPCPVYALDHAWVSPGVRISSYRLRATATSDHLRQVFDFDLTPVADPAGTPSL